MISKLEGFKKRDVEALNISIFAASVVTKPLATMDKVPAVEETKFAAGSHVLVAEARRGEYNSEL